MFDILWPKEYLLQYSWTLTDGITDQLRFIISDQEREKEQSKPTLIELCNIGERYFALNIIIMKIKCKITYHCLLENYYLLYLLFR